MSIRNHVNFDRNLKLAMKLTFIMAETMIASKMGSFIHVFMCISAKIAGKIIGSPKIGVESFYIND